MNGFVTKPIRADTLEAALREAHAGYSALASL